MHTTLQRRGPHGRWSNPTPGRTRRIVGVFIGIAALSNCAPVAHARIDPAVDFAAHAAHRGLVVDRMTDGQTAEVVPGNGGLFSNGPTFVLRSDGRTLAGLWLKDDDHITVRQSADPTAPVIGRIEATWRDDALQLVFKPAEGAVFRTGVFRRMIGAASPDVLSSRVDTNVDLRGAYGAQIRDAQGKPVGWLRVQIDPPTGPRHLYDGDVPVTLNGPMAVAAAALIDWDVNDIESHAQDVYRGD